MEVAVDPRLRMAWGDGIAKSFRVRRWPRDPRELDLVIRDEHSTAHYVGASILAAAAVGFGVVGGIWAATPGSGFGAGVTRIVGDFVLGHGLHFGVISTAMFVT